MVVRALEEAVSPVSQQTVDLGQAHVRRLERVEVVGLQFFEERLETGALVLEHQD